MEVELNDASAFAPLLRISRTVLRQLRKPDEGRDVESGIGAH